MAERSTLLAINESSVCVSAPYLCALGHGGFFHPSLASVADFPGLPEPAGPSQCWGSVGFLVAEGQKGGEVKPRGHGQRERGAGPGADAAVERHATSGPEGKK